MSAIAALILTEAPARYSDHPNNERCDMTARSQADDRRIRPSRRRTAIRVQGLIDSIGPVHGQHLHTLPPSVAPARVMPFAAGILVEGSSSARP